MPGNTPIVSTIYLMSRNVYPLWGLTDTTLTYHSKVQNRNNNTALIQRTLFCMKQWGFYPSALRAGGVLSSRSGRAGGRAGGCQTCGTHISVTAWWIFSVRSSMELSRPGVVHCHSHLPICPIWACPWAKNLSNLPQFGSRLCGSHISETTGWI